MEQSDISFEKYYIDVFRFLRGLSRNEFLAEELTQETLHWAIKSRDTFQGSSDVRVWFCSIAKNIFYTHYKNQKRVEYGENRKYEYEQQERGK